MISPYHKLAAIQVCSEPLYPKHDCQRLFVQLRISLLMFVQASGCVSNRETFPMTIHMTNDSSYAIWGGISTQLYVFGGVVVSLSELIVSLTASNACSHSGVHFHGTSPSSAFSGCKKVDRFGRNWAWKFTIPNHDLNSVTFVGAGV